MLKEEISRLEQVVADASGQQTILRQKRDKVEAAKDAMSLTDHMLAAVVRGTTQSRAAIEESKKGNYAFPGATSTFRTAIFPRIITYLSYIYVSIIQQRSRLDLCSLEAILCGRQAT